MRSVKRLMTVVTLVVIVVVAGMLGWERIGSLEASQAVTTGADIAPMARSWVQLADTRELSPREMQRCLVQLQEQVVSMDVRFQAEIARQGRRSKILLLLWWLLFVFATTASLMYR